MEKKVGVVAGNMVHDLLIRPGTTAGDVVRQLDLPGDYALSKRDGVLFGDNEEVYGQLREGEKLVASAPAIVGG